MEYPFIFPVHTAMGSQRGQIQRVFLLQGALLGCGGSHLGAAIGWGLALLSIRLSPGCAFDKLR